VNPVTVLIGILLIFAGLLLYALVVRRKRIAGYPKTWVQKGAPAPEGVDVALAVIWDCRPDKTKSIRWGGVVEWTTELPFMLGGISAAGCVINNEMPHLKVSIILPIEKSALTHEVGHYLWERSYGRVGETWINGRPVPDTDFAAWVRTTNAAIAKALGR
jgi:hypothetical protein